MEFLKATQKDIREIVNIHNANAIKNLDGDEKGFLLKEITAESICEKVLNDKQYSFFVACDETGISGFIQVHNGVSKEEWDEFQQLKFPESVEKLLVQKNKHTHILTIAVIPELKHSGIGKFLYHNLFNTYPENFFTAFIAVSPYNNDASVKFHENLGFKVVAQFVGNINYKIENYKSLFLIREPVII